MLHNSASVEGKREVEVGGIHRGVCDITAEVCLVTSAVQDTVRCKTQPWLIAFDGEMKRGVSRGSLSRTP